MKLIYIAGAGRSGSTLLGQMLNALPDFFFAGEVRNIWYECLELNEPCGSGERFRDCEFWKQVIAEAFGAPENIDLAAIMKMHLSVARERYTPLLMLFNRAPGEFFSGRSGRAQFQQVLGRIYHAIARVSGKDVVVDSSHEVSQALMLAGLPGIELKFIHLVRDSRAVAFSDSRTKYQYEIGGERRPMIRDGAVTSALKWGWRNFWASRSAQLQARGMKYARLRYEDLVRAPADALAATLRSLGFGEQDLSFIEGTSVRVGSNHAISANPVKFADGAVQIKPDDEWQVKMAKRDRRTVTLLTLPLIRRYGYAV
jgi:LPS sulfotransferase NodH